MKLIFASSNNIIVDETLNGIEIPRYDNSLVYFYYSAEKNGLTGTNQWGYEVAVNSNNIVVQVSTNVTIPEGGYAISGVGTMKTVLLNVQVGDIVSVDLETLNVKIIRDELLSSYEQSKINIGKAQLYYEQAQNSFNDLDMINVEKLYQEIVEEYNQIEKLYQSEEYSEENINLIKKIKEELDLNTEMLYYAISPSSSIEIRALWHRPNSTKFFEKNLNGVINFLKRVKELGFNTIYVETFWNGYVSYVSEYLEIHPKLGYNYYGDEYGYDYLACLTGEAKKLGIDIIAWCHIFNGGALNIKSSAIKDEWLLETYDGNTLHSNIYGGAYFLDPSNPEVLEFIEKILVEMCTKYQIAGVQYDYIRYCDSNFNQSPYRDSGYGALSEARFREETGISDPRKAVATELGREKWIEWKINNVNKAVHRFSQTIKSINPNLVIAAAVVTDIESARKTYCQDWLSWVENGDIDLLCPMIYTGNEKAVGESSKKIVEEMNSLAFLASGIAPIYYGFSDYINFLQFQTSSTNGNGTSYFGSVSILTDNINITSAEKSLMTGCYRQDAISPFSSNLQEIAKRINNEVINKINIYKNKNIINEEVSGQLISEVNKVKFADELTALDLYHLQENLKDLKTKSNILNAQEAIDDFELLLNRHIQTLEIMINRYLINHGYWDTDNERPNIEEIEFKNDNIDNNPDDNNGESNDDKNCRLFGLIDMMKLMSVLGCIIFFKRKNISEVL